MRRKKFLRSRRTSNIAFRPEWYDRLCQSVIETTNRILSKKGRRKSPSRLVSSRTKTLYMYVQRSSLWKGREPKVDVDKIQDEIRWSRLQHFEDWVTECVEEMDHINFQGNTRQIFNLIKNFKINQRLPKDLTTNENDKLLKSPEEMVPVSPRNRHLNHYNLYPSQTPV